MSYCTNCGQSIQGSAKFCGNCGHLASSLEKGSENGTGASQEFYGEGADKVIAFMSGKTMKLIYGVLIAIGLIYGLATGGLSTSRIPSAGDMVRPGLSTDVRKPAPRARQQQLRRNPGQSSVEKRNRAVANSR